MGRILSRPGRVINNALLIHFAGASLVCTRYREGGCTQAANGDSSLCVRLDSDAESHLPQTASYAVRGNGCPVLYNFDVLAETLGRGDLNYVDQDGGGTITQFASISNDEFTPGNPANYGVVLDENSLTIDEKATSASRRRRKD